MSKMTWNEEQNSILRIGFANWSQDRLIEAVHQADSEGKPRVWSLIARHAYRLGLRRGRETIRSLGDDKMTTRPRRGWTLEQMEFLREHYAAMPMADLIKGLAKLGETKAYSAIQTFAGRSGLSRPLVPPPVHTKGSRRYTTIRRPVQPQRPQEGVRTQRNALTLLPSRPAPELRTIAAGEPDTAHEKVVSKQEKAWRMLWERRPAEDVIRATGLQLREVLRINMDVREARRAQRAA
jgi:hypothetical protein